MDLALEHSTIWNYATGTLANFKGPDTMLNWMALSISTVEKYAPKQVVKQPEHGKVPTTEEQKFPPFRQTMINN